MNSNDVAYLGFLFGFGFTFAGGLIVCLALGIIALQRRIFEKFRNK